MPTLIPPDGPGKRQSVKTYLVEYDDGTTFTVEAADIRSVAIKSDDYAREHKLTGGARINAIKEDE